jgi:hypothetical protein
MPSLTTLAVLFFLAFLVLLQRRRVARSELEPLKVRIIPPKSVDVIASAMAKPLRAPVPSVSSVVAGAQRLSISDPTAGVDDLLCSFSSLSMKARHLHSCCKSRPLFGLSFNCSPLRSLQQLGALAEKRDLRWWISHGHWYNTMHGSPKQYLPLPSATRA